MGVIGAMILVLASPVAGQTPRRGVEVQAYAFGGGGKTTGATYNSEVGATATAGGGLQFLFESGIALSGELEVMEEVLMVPVSIPQSIWATTSVEKNRIGESCRSYQEATQQMSSE